ncbi:centrosomal protein of 126 kDa isoform X2 [Silurus asotus]|uniref:Centrosomal protein of 126 kDa isoform X2 n=1 Tax=Silurus asotus TaxID=30991 RepID=A0AAD5FV82_SILAS|nr:centrosomal protein of 126 kDa isoform X2 [Silurus asotus]
MQVLKDTLFYSNVRVDPDGEADEDRQLLIQEQKACRARARQYCLETNRRRKALEDRKKRRDIQEQKQRENILQQRKQRLQEATERFQRFYLPPTQKRRSGGSRAPHNLPAVSAAQAYSNLMQERNLGTSQLINPLQENLVKDQEQLRAQDRIDTQISYAESLSSLDSLENEILEYGHGSEPNNLDPSKVHDTRRPTSLQRQLNPIINQCLPNSFLEKVLGQKGLPSSSSSTSLLPVEDELANEIPSVQNFFKAEEQYNIAGQSKSSNINATIACQKQLSEYHYGTTTQENILRNKSTVSTNCKVQTAPDIISLEYSGIRQKSSPDSGELLKFTKPLSEVQAAQQTSKSLYSMASDLNKITPSLENSTFKPAEAEKPFQSTKGKPDEDGAVVLKRRNHCDSFEKFKRAERPNLVDKYSNSKLSYTILPKSFKMVENPDQTSAHTLTNHIDLKNVQFIKGILKEKYKCKGNEGDAKFSYIPSHFTFSKQVAINIKDSLEISRSKGRGPGINKCPCKKLRWFDEVNSDGEENKEITKKELSKQAKIKSRQTQPSQQPVVDQQQGSVYTCYMNKPSCIPKKTSADPTGPNTTKQAWSDLGKKLEPTVETKMEKAAFSTNGNWVPQRTQSAKTGNFPFQARRGTTIRPQSSSQVQNIVKSQGKLLVPQPPPKSEVTGGNSSQAILYNSKKGNNDASSQSKACLAVERGLCKDFPSEPLPQHESNILSPVPPSYVCMYENVSKGIYTVCPSNNYMGSGRNGFRNGVLDCTPTEEEISQLWHGVRSALASKDDSDVIDGDQQDAVDLDRFQKATEIRQSLQGLSALSLEEHQLLQSLERLNHRLQYVQDAAAGNTTLKRIVDMKPAHNQSPQPGERSCATLRRYRGVSADSHTHPHRRF